MLTSYKRISLASDVLLLVALIGMAGSIYIAIKWYNSRSVLDVVMDRGYLRCGVNGDLPGYSFRSKNIAERQAASDTDFKQYKRDLDSGFTKEIVGFEPDFCWVIAVGIFGDNKARVLFKPLDAKARFTAVSNKEVDVVVRNMTITSDRDTNPKFNIDYGPVIYHDGQKIMVHKETINSLKQLDGQEICVLKNTTISGNIEEFFNERGIKYVPRYASQSGELFKTNSEQLASYLLNECQAITSDESILLSYKRRVKFADDYAIIPETPFSYEPLAPFAIANDSRWLEMITYSIYVTILAEQLGVTKENIEKRESTFGAPITWFNMGIKQDNSTRIIEYLGNYGEIYARNLGDSDRGRNNISTSGGLLVSPPLK